MTGLEGVNTCNETMVAGLEGVIVCNETMVAGLEGLMRQWWPD